MEAVEAVLSTRRPTKTAFEQGLLRLGVGQVLEFIGWSGVPGMSGVFLAAARIDYLCEFVPERPEAVEAVEAVFSFLSLIF